ncbi:DUF4347 domain-containing protein [Marinomonas sp. FW-1]|uniref:DUF4347 domain-containing protein n=1 Tax=Marinomonas sp. FW-1 TaxID=2071621 RepID=UPI0010C12CD5|nr:DUF4347 domain-containing protein [Marinomonas sp. FW-1]
MKKQDSNTQGKKMSGKYSAGNKTQARKPLITALEPRLLLDGAAVATAVDVISDAQLHHDASQTDSHQNTDKSIVVAPTEVRAVDPAQNNGRKEVVFIESNVADYQSLMDGTKAGVEIVLLDSTQDGLSQMAEWAKTHSGYDAIHLISHGSEASVNLGALSLDSSAIRSRSADLAQLGAALNEDGDLLLYGCDVASGEGQDFITTLAQATQADVAASDDLTGATSLGGNWVLEKSTGQIDVSTLQDVNYQGTLANVTFGFESGVSGVGSKTVTQDKGGETLTVTANQNIFDSSYTGNHLDGSTSIATYVGSPFPNQLDFSITGKIFDFSSIRIANWGSNSDGLVLTFTASNGTDFQQTIPYGADVYSVDLSNNSSFQGISSVTITTTDPEGIAIDFDSVVLSNIASASDNTPPNAPSTPDLSSASDTGTSSTDNVTSKTTPTVTGTAEANSTVKLYDTDGTTLLGSTTANGSGNWSITSSTLSEGSHTLTATATDASNNVSSASSGLTITIDTTAPTTTIASAALSADTGTSGDFITNTAQQTISGTLSADLASGESVYVSLDNGANWTVATASIGSNTWSLTGQALTGSNTLKVKVSDTAGNDGTVYSQAYVLDTTAPTTTIATAEFSADTGTSGDFITNTAQQTISGTLSANLASGESVYVSLDNGANWAVATASVVSNTWSLAGQTLAGSNTLKVKVSDTAGNDGTVYSQAYILDTQSPDAPSAADLSAGSDTGSSNTDNITSDTTPTVTGSAEAGSTVTLYDTDGITVLGSTTADGSGNWSITSTTLSAGEHTLTTKTIDAAGNVSIASGGLTLTVDTTAPTLTSSSPADDATNIAPSSDISLTFSEDIYSGSGLITLINTSTGTTVETFNIATSNQISMAGSVLTLSPTHDLAEATGYAIQISNAALTDKAGNAVAGIIDNTTLNFTTGVTDSRAPTFLAVQRTNDNVITDTTASFTLRFDEAVNANTADFILSTSGSVVGTISSISGSGTNTLTINVSGIAGVGTIGVNLATNQGLQDLAGNVLPSTEPAVSELYSVDTQAPTLVSINRLDAATTSADSVRFVAIFSEPMAGLSVSDLELTGSAATGASIVSVTGTDNGFVITVDSVATNGTLGVQLASSASVTDAVGNALATTTTSAVNEQYTIDQMAPTATAIIRTNPELSSADTVTFDVTFSEAVSNVSADDFTISGDVTGTITNVTGSGAAYTVTVANISGDGALGLDFTASQNIVDKAGNSFAGSEPSTDESYTIDNTLPTVASISRGMVNQIAAGSSTDVVFTVVFSETVSGVAASDFTVTGNAINTGVSSVSSTDGKVFKVTVAGVNGSIGQTVGLNFTGSATDAVSQASSAQFTSGDSYTIAGTLLNEGALTQAQLDAIVDLNREGSLLAQSVENATQVIIVDSRVPGLVEHAKTANPEVDIWLLDGSRSAVGQISEILANYSNLDALHILSHGGVGEIYLGAETVSADAINQNSATFAAWGNALSDSGDILLYGCNVAQGDTGVAFINQLAQVTGADIAASDDLTGSAELGGDWVLEKSTGEQDIASIKVIEFSSTLSTNLTFDGFSKIGGTFQPSVTGTYGAWTFTIYDTFNDTNGFGSVPELVPISDSSAITGTSAYLKGTGTGDAGETRYVDMELSSGEAFTPSSIKLKVNNHPEVPMMAVTLTAFDDSGNQLGTYTSSLLANGEQWNVNFSDGNFPAFSGIDKLRISIPTNYVAIDDFNYSIVSGNTAPTISGAPASITTTEDTASNIDLSEVAFADGDNDPLTVTLSVNNGTFSTPADGSSVGSGVTETLVNSTTITLVGSAADINTYLDTASNIQYTGAANASGTNVATLTISASDGTANLASDPTVSINITNVNDAPTVASVPATITVTEDTASNVDLSSVVFADVDGDDLTVTLSIDNGSFSSPADGSSFGSGVTETLVNSKTITLFGSATDINTYLNTAANIQYTGATNASGNSAATLTISASDANSATLSSNPTVSIDITSVNDTPTISGVSANQAVNDTATVTPFSSVVLADVDSANLSVTVALDTAAKGAFTAASLTASGFTDNNNGTYSLASTSIASAQAALRQLVFSPADNRVAPGSTETTTFTVTVNDGTTNTSNTTTTVVSTSINDAPTDISLSDASFSHSEGSSDVVVGSFSAMDADTGESFTYTLVSGTGDTDNGKFNIDGANLRVTDRANVPAGTYSVRVQVNDGDATYEKAFTITVTDDQAPTISSVVPTDNSTGVSVADSIEMTFDEEVSLGNAGSITLYDITGNGANSLTIDVANHNGQLSIVGNKLTISPTDNLIATNQYAIQLSLGALQDSSNNELAAITDTTSFNFTTGSVDTVPPTVALADISGPITAGSGSVAIHFSEQVTGVDLSDFSLTKDGIAYSLNGAQLSGSGSEYSIDLSGVTNSAGNYVLTLNTADIMDTSGNALLAEASTSFVVDVAAPTSVAIVRAGDEIISGDSATFTVVFSEAVQGVDVSDFSLSGTATGGTIDSITRLSDSVYSITISGITTDGTLGVDLNSTGTSISDLAGNAISGGKEGQQITRDTSAPSVVAINRDSAELTTGGSSTFTVSFDEAVTGIDVSDFSLSGSATGTIASVTGSGATYQVTVNNLSGNGSLRLDLNAIGTNITDSAGNAIASGFIEGDSLTLDNVAPTVASAQSFALDEGMASGTVIGQVKASDANGIDQFAIQSGNESGYFNIDDDGVLTLTSAGAAALDYEKVTAYTLYIVATDAAGHESSAMAISIAVQDINDNTPQFTSAATATLAENSGANASVYTAQATDADASAAFNSVTYALKAVGDYNAFTIDSVTGEVVLKADADYETKASYSFTVIASDGQRSAEKNVALSIADLNDNAPVLTSGATSSVDENAATSTVIYTAKATDADGTAVNNTLSYSLSGADADKLNIDAVTGEVTLKASADYETQSSYSFNVIASDNQAGTEDATQAVTVSVNDLNDNAPVFTSGLTGSVNENAATSTVIYTAKATDADGTAANNTLRYSLSGTDADKLNIDAVTGKVTLKASADYETQSSYSFNVIASDNQAGTEDATQAVTVSVVDINEAPVANNDSASATEAGGVNNTTAGSSATGNVLSNDTDIDGIDSKTVIAVSNGTTTGTVGQALVGSYGSLTLNADGSYTYEIDNDIATVQALPAGASLTESFSYTMADQGSLTAQATLTITVNGANDAPVVNTSLDNAQGTIGRSLAPITLPANLFSDVDQGQTATLTWSVSNLPQGLSYDSSTRVISGTPVTGAGLNTILVTATDSAGSSVSTSFLLELYSAPVDTSLNTPPLSMPPTRPAAPTTGFEAPEPTLTIGALPQGTVSDGEAQNRGFIAELTAPSATVPAPSMSAPPAPPAPPALESAAISRVSVNVDQTGQVQFSQQQISNDASLAVASLTPDAQGVNITLADDIGATNYSATLADGTALPDWVTVDAATGEISINPPAGETRVNLRISAQGLDGSTRVLELDLDLSEAINAPQTPANVNPDNPAQAYLMLDQQLEMATQELEGYGSDLMKLLVS